MNKVAVAELQGEALDYWVAKAEGCTRINKHPSGIWYSYNKDSSSYGEIPRYSSLWCDGGPIIEREEIAIAKLYVPFDGAIKNGLTWASLNLNDTIRMDGRTPLEAAMRCFVAIKLGQYVDSVIF